MKTKTTIPWAAILTEYNNRTSNFICENSPIFRMFWNQNKEIIKELGAKFLKEIKCKEFYVIPCVYRNCLFYFDRDSVAEGTSFSKDEIDEKEMKIRKQFLEYMAAKSKPKTKYSYFRHAANFCFGNPGGPTFLVRRDNKTGEFETVHYNIKRIFPAGGKEPCENHVKNNIWVPANQKEINKIKRLYRKLKYLYYRHKEKHCFGNPESKDKYIVRHDNKDNLFYMMGFEFANENSLLSDSKKHIFVEAIQEGTWIPARPKEIKLAIKLNK